MKKALFSLLLIATISCKSVISLVENVNQKKKFENTKAYKEFIDKKIGVPNDKIIILNKESYKEFLNEIFTKKLSTYFGIIYKNNFVSADQLEMKSCAGQIENLYKMVAANSDEIHKSEKSALIFLDELHLDHSKNSLLFIYSYKLGGLSKSKIRSVIRDFSSDPNFDYRIISLDNSDIINN